MTNNDWEKEFDEMVGVRGLFASPVEFGVGKQSMSITAENMQSKVKAFIKDLLQQQKAELIEELEKELIKHKDNKAQASYLMGYKHAIEKLKNIWLT